MTKIILEHNRMDQITNKSQIHCSDTRGFREKNEVELISKATFIERQKDLLQLAKRVNRPFLIILWALALGNPSTLPVEKKLFSLVWKHTTVPVHALLFVSRMEQ